ncbi:hypothetical protein R6G74_09080, partial [Actinotignum timonense]|nr:hypothetical protein [Actinotignum timonense]
SCFTVVILVYLLGGFHPHTQTIRHSHNFQNLAKDNKLAFYPDWPVAGFYDQLVSNMQSLMSGSKTPEQAMQDLQTAYEEGRADLLE